MMKEKKATVSNDLEKYLEQEVTHKREEFYAVETKLRVMIQTRKTLLEGKYENWEGHFCDKCKKLFLIRKNRKKVKCITCLGIDSNRSLRTFKCVICGDVIQELLRSDGYHNVFDQRFIHKTGFEVNKTLSSKYDTKRINYIQAGFEIVCEECFNNSHFKENWSKFKLEQDIIRVKGEIEKLEARLKKVLEEAEERTKELKKRLEPLENKLESLNKKKVIEK